jgi:hypothetical protein
MFFHSTDCVSGNESEINCVITVYVNLIYFLMLIKYYENSTIKL